MKKPKMQVMKKFARFSSPQKISSTLATMKNISLNSKVYNTSMYIFILICMSVKDPCDEGKKRTNIAIHLTINQ